MSLNNLSVNYFNINICLFRTFRKYVIYLSQDLLKKGKNDSLNYKKKELQVLLKFFIIIKNLNEYL